MLLLATSRLPPPEPPPPPRVRLPIFLRATRSATRSATPHYAYRARTTGFVAALQPPAEKMGYPQHLFSPLCFACGDGSFPRP